MLSRRRAATSSFLKTDDWPSLECDRVAMQSASCRELLMFSLLASSVVQSIIIERLPQQTFRIAQRAAEITLGTEIDYCALFIVKLRL